MKKLEYTISDKLGIHARPAGLLVKCTSRFLSSITVCLNGKAVDAKRIIGIMGLGAKLGDTVTFEIEGDDETEAYNAIKQFCEETL